MISREATLADRGRWEEFLCRRENGNLRQTFAWGQIKATAAWEPVYVQAEEAGEVRATLLMLKKTIPGLGRSVLYGCRGPALDWEDGEALEGLVEGIREAARRHRAIFLRIDPEPHQAELMAPALGRCGFRRINLPFTSWNRTLYELRVSLDQDEAGLFSRIRGNTRRDINSAYRKGVQANADFGAKDYRTFYDLMSQLELRKYAIKHPFDYYKKVLDEIVGSDMGVLLKAIYEGEVIAVLLVAFLGRGAWALYSAYNNDYRRLMPSKVLWWEAIKLARSRDCAYFDMGATQGTGFNHDSNLDLYKTAFRPEVVNFPGYFDLVFSPVLYRLFKFSETRVIPYVYKLRTMRGKGSTQAPAEERPDPSAEARSAPAQRTG